MRRLLTLTLALLLVSACAPTFGGPAGTAVPLASPTDAAAEPGDTRPTASFPASFPTATARPAPRENAGYYANPEAGVALSYPPAWQTSPGESDGQLIWFYPPGRELFVLLVSSPHRAGAPLEESAHATHAALAGGLDDLERLEDGPHTLGDGRDGWASVYRAQREDGPLLLRMTSSARGRRLVTVLAFGTPEGIESHRAQIDRVSDSLKLSAPLRYGIPEDQALLDLGGESDNPHAYDPAHNGGGTRIFSGLATFTPDLRLQPDLAESWELSEDGTIYTFHLRPNARFHNGRPVTAADVIYSWDRAADPATDSPSVLTYLGDIVGMAERHAGTAGSIAGLRALDERTLEVRIDAPKPYFLLKLTYIATFIVDRANVESGPEWYRTPNGTGPYRLIRWEPGEVRLYERNQDFYLEPPAIPYIIEQIYAGAGLRMYETGDLDWVGIGGYNLERARDPQGPWPGQLRESVDMCTDYVGIDSSRAPFDDPQVRRAFALAIDRERLAELSQGSLIPSGGLYPPALPGYRAGQNGQTFDPEQARRLLAESRYGGAAGLPPIVFTSSGWGGSINWTEAALAEMWQRNLGVSIQFENLEPNRWSEAMHDGQHGQLYMYGWCADYPDPENFADALFHTGAEQNLGNYANPELDALLERARVEPDGAERLALYQQAEQLIVDDAAAIFLSHSRSYVLVQPRLQGYVSTPIGVPIERYLSLAPEP